MNIIELQTAPIPFDKAELEKNKFLPIALFDELGNFYALVGDDKIYKTSKDIFVDSVKSIFQSFPNAKFPKSVEGMASDRYKKMEKLMKAIPRFLQNRYLMEVDALQKSFLLKQYNEINFLLKKEITNLKKSHFEYMAAPALARKKAYGKVNLNDALFEKYGVRLKKQDGSDFTQNELSKAIDIVSFIFEFLKIPKSLAESKKLKVSFINRGTMKFVSGVAGVFLENYKSVGVSFARGVVQAKIVLAHEIGHWLDYVLSNKTMVFASGQDGTIQNLLATSMLQNMNHKNTTSDYWRRKTECFARAVEEYVAIEAFGQKTYFSKAFYCNETNYEQKIKPLVKLVVNHLECM